MSARVHLELRNHLRFILAHDNIHNVSIGARLNVAFASIWSFYLGTCYILLDPSRFENAASYDAFLQHATMRTYGVLLVVLASFLLVTYHVGWGLRIAVLLTAMWYTYFAVLFLLAFFGHPPATPGEAPALPTGVGPYGFIACSMIATFLGVVSTRKEPTVDALRRAFSEQPSLH